MSSKEIKASFGPKSRVYTHFYNYMYERKTQERKFKEKLSKWKEQFESIYEIENISELFIKQTYYILIVKGIYIYKYILTRKEEFQNKESFQAFSELYTTEQLPGSKLKEFEFYNWIGLDKRSLQILFDTLSQFSYQTPNIFHFLYQGIFSEETRHFMGEFYTPSLLVKKMVDYTYNIGDKVLDPSCGSGNFLIEIVLRILDSDRSESAKIAAINNIYGFDINPIAICTVKIQVLLITLKFFKDLPKQTVENNFVLVDSLSFEMNGKENKHTPENLYSSFDLIIGNPPWLTYKDADDSLRERLKEISAKYKIKPAAHNITNIEEAVIFLYHLPFLFLKRDAQSKVAFVMPKSILVSSHNQKARTFNVFDNVEILEFKESMFNIDFCCVIASMKGELLEEGSIFDTFPIKCKVFSSDSMKLLEKYTIEPYVYFQTPQPSQYLVKKLIKSERKEELLPCHLSDYYDKFIQGADLLPKSLLYVQIQDNSKEEDQCVIDPWISPQAKGNWKKKYYSNTQVECKHLFKATLSRGLYPFYIAPYDIFLPLNNELKYNPSDLGQSARKHWDILAEIYQKENGRDLFSRGINYRNKLCKNRKVRAEQRAPYKVVFPNAKTLMAAVIEDPNEQIFIDSTLYYYGTKSKTEAYYLCGMLNIRELYKSVKLVSDTRHHHKRPLYFNIPEFKGTDNHLKISSLAQQCTAIVENYIDKVKKPRISQIWKNTEQLRQEITHLGLSLLTSVKGINVLKS